MQEKSSSRKRLPADIIALLGAHDLALKLERGNIQREISEIHVHPDWEVYGPKYDADLAVLVLDETVNFTDYIRPICMPNEDTVIEGATGTIVGWGLSENSTGPHEDILRYGITKTLNGSYCYTTDPTAAVISSLRTFCGGGEGGWPNRGDSGGGVFVLSGSRWVQYGIISTIRANATNQIDPNSFAIYTNIKMFKQWIADIVEQFGGLGGGLGGANNKINLNCEYSNVPSSLRM